MKIKSSFLSSTTAILAIAFCGFFAAPSGFASNQAAFAKAKGKYTGTLSGSASGVGVSIPPSPATVRMPKGKGKAKLKILGLSATAKVTKATCRQGGKKVIQKGTIKVPASVTGGLGAIKGPFKSVITLGGKPKMKATTRFSVFGAAINGVFKGSK